LVQAAAVAASRGEARGPVLFVAFSSAAPPAVGRPPMAAAGASIEYDVNSDCAQLPVDTLDAYPCGSDHTPSPMASRVPLEATPVLEWPGVQLTAVAVTMEDGHTIAFLGDSQGQLHRVYLGTGSDGHPYSTQSIQPGSAVSRDLTFDGAFEHLYVMTQSTLLRVPVAACAQHLDCASCLAHRDPYCGWCVLLGRCSRRSECSRGQGPARWLWSFGPEPGCLQVAAMSPANISREERREVFLTVPDLPPLWPGEPYSCHFGEYQSPALPTVSGVRCLSPDPSGAPVLPRGADHVSVSVELRLGAVVIAKAPLSFYDCVAGPGDSECVMELEGREVAVAAEVECELPPDTRCHVTCQQHQLSYEALQPELRVGLFLRRAGNLRFSLGPVQYDGESPAAFPLAAQVGLGVGTSLLALGVSIIVLMYRRKSKQALRDYKKVQIQLENLESSVRDRCKKDLTAPPTPPPSPRQFIHTLESQRTFSARDRAYVASLLTVALHGKLEYFTDILRTLLSDLVAQYVAKNPKLMLRRTETVVEKLLTNWMSICLYTFVRDTVGEPLYMLFRGIKHQVDKGPVDSVTGKAKYTLNDNRLLREDVEYQPLTLNALLAVGPGAGEAQGVPVKVLDCDTISQAKEKVLDQLCKGLPLAQRPDSRTLDVEWRSGVAGHLILSDEDVTSEVQGLWRRLNTLQHYKVPDGATVALVPCLTKHALRENQDYVPGESESPPRPRPLRLLCPAVVPGSGARQWGKDLDLSGPVSASIPPRGASPGAPHPWSWQDPGSGEGPDGLAGGACAPAAAVPTISRRYYADIRQTVPASDQEMNSLLAELSRNYSGDLGARVALHELYKYINKYYDQIITALEEDSTAQKMQLGYRLQQVAAAVENKVTDL
ncbi:PREDICTED: plexin-B1, partial [Myotis davidii]|uniref:plexin-B1 n=1 Tax=Myotis davidii TaxID=225400 RepID=UPI000767659E